MDDSPLLWVILLLLKLVIGCDRFALGCKVQVMDEVFVCVDRKCTRVVGSALHLDERQIMSFEGNLILQEDLSLALVHSQVCTWAMCLDPVYVELSWGGTLFSCMFSAWARLGTGDAKPPPPPTNFSGEVDSRQGQPPVQKIQIF